jgi:hypothetical protein
MAAIQDILYQKWGGLRKRFPDVVPKALAVLLL